MEALPGFRDSLVDGSFNSPVLDRQGPTILQHICDEVCFSLTVSHILLH